MKLLARLLPLLSFFAAVTSFGQGVNDTDLFNRWRVFEDGSYRPHTSEDGMVHAVYIMIKTGEFKDQRLRITSFFNPSIFVNGKFVRKGEGRVTHLSIDSLRSVVGSSSLTIGVYQKKITPHNLKTHLVSVGAVANSENSNVIPMPRLYFRDFVIVASLILMIILVVMMRLNSKLASDYFSVKKIFLVQDVDENYLSAKGTSGSNFLYYAFCSLLIALGLMIIFHFMTDRLSVAWFFRSQSFIGAIGQWFKLAALILIAMLAKIFIVFIGTRLFGLHDVASLQIFNWIRLLFVVSGLLVAVLVVYHISRGLNVKVYSALYTVIPWAVAAWLLILYPKVARRSGYPMFHIFSYLCATEIIPLLISIKLLYY